MAFTFFLERLIIFFAKLAKVGCYLDFQLIDAMQELLLCPCESWFEALLQDGQVSLQVQSQTDSTLVIHQIYPLEEASQRNSSMAIMGALLADGANERIINAFPIGADEGEFLMVVIFGAGEVGEVFKSEVEAHCS